MADLDVAGVRERQRLRHVLAEDQLGWTWSQGRRPERLAGGDAVRRVFGVAMATAYLVPARSSSRSI